MNYNRNSTKEKWTFMKYIRSFDQIVTYASKIREMNSNVNATTLDKIQSDFECLGIYNPRFGKRNRITLECKIRHLVYFMFGYTERIGDDLKFVFSPLGNLLLDNYDNKEYVAKIFASMLFSIEFHHPFNHMSRNFKLHPFRIIFQLMNDPKLGEKLYNDEVFYLVSFLKNINESIYDELVEDILNFRRLSCEEKYKLFKSDESVLADSLHLWRYTVGTLEDAGILINNSTNNVNYGNLIQGKDTRRTYRYEFTVIHPQVKSFIKLMLNNYRFDEATVMSRDDLFESDKVTELYNFYPEELLQEIGILNNKEQERILSILSITKKIEQASFNQQKGDCYIFEELLTDAFKYFEDVRAEKVGGAGKTDIECLYMVKNKKFDIEAKSTNRKLSLINAGRLKSHRNKIGSKYTIVVTPDYVPAVIEDIFGQEIVIITSRTFSNLLYQLTVKFGRNIKYGFLDDIIENNLGKDISPVINSYICSELSNVVYSSIVS